MAEKIVKKFSVQHVVQGLETALTMYKDLEKMGVDSGEAIQKITAQLEAAKLNPETSLEGLKIYEDILKKILKEINTASIKSMKGVGSVSKKQAEEVAQQLEVVENQLQDLEKQEAKIDKKFQVQEDGTFGASRSGDLYKSTVAPELDKKMAKSTFVNPFTGKVLTDAANYTKQMEKLDDVLDGQTKANKATADSIRKKLEAGTVYKDLLPKEIAYLTKIEKANNGVELSSEAIYEQMKTNKKLQEEEQKILQKLYSEEKKQIKIKKDKLVLDRIRFKESQKDFKERVQQAENLTDAEKQANEELIQIQSDSIKETANLNEEQKRRTKEQKESTKATKENSKETHRNTTTLGKAAKQVFNYGIAFNALRKIYRETIRTITELDKAFTEMAIVTTMTREETWALADQMFNLAKETGFTATEIAKLSTVYFRQGRALSEVIELTRVAAMAARVAGISAQESANFLTSAINAFRLSSDEALAVSDRFAALAASSASSYQELAVGLSKFAAQANVAGVGIDFAMGMLAKGVETTREAPETIGTAIKTVTARMRELTDLGKTFEDGMDVNRVETALRQVGVALRDESGQFRNLENVLTDIGMRWETLNKNQQASIAVSLAGTRQQSRLIAIMNDFDRTMELVDISQESAGATAAQHVQFMNSLEAATVNMQNAYQQFIKTISDSEIIIGILNSLTFVIESLTSGLDTMGIAGKNLMVALISLTVVSKSLSLGLSLLSAILIKQKVITESLTLAKIRQIIANKGLIASITALWVALGPVTIALLAITAALAGLVLVVGVFSTSTERAEKKFKDFSTTMTAGRYELTRTERSFRDLTEEIEKFNNMPFLTPEQSDELNTATEKLAELVGEENIVRIQGAVDLELSQGLIRKWVEEQEQEFEDNINETFNETIEKVFDKSEADIEERYNSKGEVVQRTTLGYFIPSEELTTEEINNFSDALVFQYGKVFEDLEPEQEKLARLLLQTMDFSNINLDFDDLETFFKENFEGAFKEIVQFEENFESEGETLAERVDSYNKNISKINDPEVLNLLKNRFSDLQFIIDEGLDLDQLGILGLDTEKEIQDFAKIYGEATEQAIIDINERANKISEETGFNLTNSVKLAWMELAKETENAEMRSFYYGQAVEKTSLESSQAIDTIINRLKSVNEQQEKILDGTATAEDIYNFVENNADLFESMEDVTAFLSGKSIDAKVFAQQIQEEENAVINLANSMSVLNDENATLEDRQDAIKQIAMSSALLQYNGILSQVTESQYRYNESLKAYDILTKLGVNTADLSERILRDQLYVVDQAGQSILDTVGEVEESFGELKIALEESEVEQQLTENFKDYIQFDKLTGRFLPVYDAMNGLSSTTIETLTGYVDELNSSVDESLKIFEDARETALRLEKEKIDAQKEAYQDYYDALDRMEKRSETTKSREEIVEQISRLQGATDEVSRQKALSLQQELNNLNQQNAKDIIQQNREDALEALDQRYEEAEARWAEAGAEFFSTFSQAITDGSSEFGDSVANSLSETYDLEDLPTQMATTFSTFIDDLEDALSGISSLETPSSIQAMKDTLVDLRTEELLKTGNFITAGRDAGMAARMVAEQQIQEEYGFAKGGMVDFTGRAMLHGSRKNPEAVLNPEQTEMFMGLRNALEKISIQPSSSGSISIDNISISTGSLNTNQDFASAGETLAKAFKNAIQRKGITVNTKR